MIQTNYTLFSSLNEKLEFHKLKKTIYNSYTHLIKELTKDIFLYPYYSLSSFTYTALAICGYVADKWKECFPQTQDPDEIRFNAIKTRISHKIDWIHLKLLSRNFIPIIGHAWALCTPMSYKDDEMEQLIASYNQFVEKAQAQNIALNYLQIPIDPFTQSL